MHRRSFLHSGLISGALLAVGAAAPVLAATKKATQAATKATAFNVDGFVALYAYQSFVEEHLAGVLRSIRALAVTSEAKSAQWASIRPALDRFSHDLMTDDNVWFALPDGSYSTTSSGPVSTNLKDRDYFPLLMDGGDIIGNLVLSKSTGHRVIIVATPVVKDGRVVAVIGVSLQARLIAGMVMKALSLPDDLNFFALDEKGQIGFHKDPKWMFEYPAALGDELLKSTVAKILSQPEGIVDYKVNGIPRTALFNGSDPTHWHFVLVKIHK